MILTALSLIILLLAYMLICTITRLWKFLKVADAFEHQFNHYLRLEDFLEGPIVTKQKGTLMQISFGNCKKKILDIELFKADEAPHG